MSLPELLDRDRLLVDHIARYHLSTPEILAHRVLPGITANALKKILQRLVRSRWLRSLPLYQQRYYYILSRSACEQLNISVRRSLPLGHEGLVQHFALLTYCAHSDVKLLSAVEFSLHFPELCRPHLPAGCYFLRPEVGQLGWIMVDHGSRTERLASKVGRVIGKRYALPPFARLIQAGGFTIVVLTATPLKQHAIERALADRPPKHVAVAVQALPELEPLLVGSK